MSRSALLIWIFIIPPILLIVHPLLDKILNLWFLDLFNNSLSSLNIMIWSTQTNYILIIIWLLMFLAVFRFIMRSISVFQK